MRKRTSKAQEADTVVEEEIFERKINTQMEKKKTLKEKISQRFDEFLDVIDQLFIPKINKQKPKDEGNRGVYHKAPVILEKTTEESVEISFVPLED